MKIRLDAKTVNAAALENGTTAEEYVAQTFQILKGRAATVRQIGTERNGKVAVFATATA